MTQWSIILAEYASSWGADEDLKRFGMPFSHPFLIVENEKGEVMEEIHGRWQNSIRTRQFVNLEDHYKDETRSLPLPELYPMAVVSPCTPRDAHKAIERQMLFSGERDVVMGYIDALKAIVPDLNAERHLFYRYAKRGSGFANCQIILAEAMSRVPDFPPVPGLKLAHTGWTETGKDAINQRHEHA